MLRWRPGDPPQVLQATDEGCCAASLTHASRDADDATKEAFDTIASWADYRICDDAQLTPDGCAETRERPGLFRAAIADIPAYHSEYEPETAAAVLHHLVEDATTAYWTLRTGLFLTRGGPWRAFTCSS